MSDEVATLLAKKFIARQDVKAIQHSNGAWSPHTASGKADGDRIKWRMGDLRAHLAATSTFGHYMLDTDSKCKLFAFDIDLEKNSPPESPTPFVGTYLDENAQPVEFDAREAWRDRKHPSRMQTKVHLMLVAKALANIITTDLEIPTAVAYSGNKGLHVYGFTGHTSAKDAREGAEIVLEAFGEFEPTRGNNFWRSKDQSRTNFLRNFTIEVFPKQDTIGEGGLGNLMRLPLGKNLKSPADPTFFIDPAAPDVLTNWTQMDAVSALTIDSPWRTA